MSTSPERDEQLLAIGYQCSLPSCLLVDFLPFKCQHCNERFCAEHFTVDGHKCAKYDESKYNRVAPSCPLCNEPVAIRPGQDPNIQMEHHISTDCSVMTGKLKAKSKPVCARSKCRKVLFAPIRCDQCNLQFCPAHRFPSDHTCSAAFSQSKPATSTASTSKPAIYLTTKASATGNATVDVIKNTIASSPPDATKQSSSHTINPFSSSRRRAEAEHDSRVKALRERYKKGLLNDEEIAVLAREEAGRAKGFGKKKDGCIIM